jgi:histidyl-tRNA synthetase
MEELRNLKGTKDYLPAEQSMRNKIRDTLTSIFELYEFRPLETPILNSYDLMASKYGGGAEILKETYKIQDQGERDIALRYDLTVPFIKTIALYNDIRLPFRRYEIGKVFRDGPIKTGRLREFTQCDCDIVGVTSVQAEAELLSMANRAFKSLDLPVKIQYNNRKLLNGLLYAFGIDSESWADVILTLDKFEKIGISGVTAELQQKGYSETVIDSIDNALRIKDELLQPSLVFGNNEYWDQGYKELTEFNTFLYEYGLETVSEFNIFLARGLQIYTGTVYEVFLQNSEIKSSIASGGRYDNVIGDLIADEKSYPAVGLSFGLDVILAGLQEVARTTDSVKNLIIVPLGTQIFCAGYAEKLRDLGIRVSVDMSGKKLKNILGYAEKERISYVIIIGEEEILGNTAKMRNMLTRNETEINLETPNEVLATFLNDI